MQNNAQNTTHVSQQEEQKVSGVILDMWLTSDKKSTLGKILPAVVDNTWVHTQSYGLHFSCQQNTSNVYQHFVTASLQLTLSGCLKLLA